jgi:YidC/Oxa1 family membrane protein insertase
VKSYRKFIVWQINLQKGMEGHPMTGATKIVSRGVAFMIVPFTMSFSKV